MDMYVTYESNPKNPSAEYQKRGKTWYKRKKGSSDAWVKVNLLTISIWMKLLMLSY